MLDVVVIGAGLSGLQAALTCHQNGLSVIVVEARDRVGGKTWSVPLASDRGVADLGAAWINDKLQTRVGAYARKFKMGTVEQRLEGLAIMEASVSDRIEFPFGIVPEFTPEEKDNLAKIRHHIQAASLRPEDPNSQDDSVTLDQYVRKLGAVPKTIAMVNLWARVMHGVESTEETAAFFIDYCRRNHGLLAIRADDRTGGQHQRLLGGTQAIGENLAKLIGYDRIHLSSPVAAIEDRRSHVAVSTTTGRQFLGRKCILSVPSTMYRELKISPGLPAELQRVVDATILGDYNKAIVCYDRPWWRDMGYNGFFMSYVGPVIAARDTSVDEKRQYSLTCFVNGAPGRAWSKMHPHERRKAVLEQLAKGFNVGPSSELWRPIEFFEQIWMHEKYSRGALVPVTAVGHLKQSAPVYGKPVGNLHFVGTEYAAEWKGYMEGALCSGEQGAAEILGALPSELRASL